jgi:hypothetical protein
MENENSSLRTLEEKNGVVFILKNEVTGTVRRWFVEGATSEKMYDALGDVGDLESQYGVLDGGGSYDDVEGRWETGYSSYEIEGGDWKEVSDELVGRLKKAGYKVTKMKSKKEM